MKVYRNILNNTFPVLDLLLLEKKKIFIFLQKIFHSSD